MMNDSPLKSTASAIRLISMAGGVPGEFVDDMFEFRHTWRAWMRVIFVYAMEIPLMCLLHYALTQRNSSLLEIGPQLHLYMSITDSMCFPGLFAINLLMGIIHLIFFGQGFSRFNEQLVKFRALRRIPLSPRRVRQQACRTMLFSCFICAINVICSVLGALAGTIALFPHEPAFHAWQIVAFFIWFYSCLVSFFPPVLLIGHLLSHQLFGTLELYQEAYRNFLCEKYPCGRSRLWRRAKDDLVKSQAVSIYSVIQVHPADGRTPGEVDIPDCPESSMPHPRSASDRKTTLEQDLLLGLDLQYLISEQAQFMGSFFMVEFGLDLLIESVSAYLSFLVPEALMSPTNEDPLKFWVKMLVGLCSLGLLSLALLRHCGIMKLGHNCGSENLQLMDTLQRGLVEMNYHTLNDREKRLLELLLEKSSNCNPVRPHQVFFLNFSTGLAALGLCLTYIFVLLQFRMTEGLASSGKSNNFTLH